MSKAPELKIAKGVSLPISAVTETFAAIGRRGAGKSYLATMIAEQMLDAQAQVIAIDPVGIWWGLRVGADGKSKGKEIFVIGGEHGDVPLVPEAGKRIAQLVVEKGISAVIDVSGFRIGEHKRFTAEFAEEFFHLKKTRKTPVHMFVEEAQTLIPQRVGADEAKMVGAFERIIRLGRNYGIGCTLITQRPQSVNKEVLSQVECLCVLQVTGLHERKALEGWVQERGADRTLIGELPSLEQGEGYIWSPAFLKIYKRVHFSKKETFDASATPIVGKETKAASIQAVDIEKLKKDMADVIDKAEKDNPATLRRRIAELEKSKTTKQTITVDPRGIVERAVKNAVRDLEAKHDKERTDWLRQIDNWFKILKSISEATAKALDDYKKINRTKKKDQIIGVTMPLNPEAQNRLNNAMPVVNKFLDRFTAPEVNLEGPKFLELSGPERRILNAIRWLQDIRIDEPEQTAVAFLAGYKFGGGAFNNPRGSLNAKGLVNYRPGNRIVLTDQGMQLAEPSEIPLDTQELHNKVLSILPGPEKKLLEVLLRCYPDAITNDDLAGQTGYTAGTGGFNNPKGKLRTLGLVEYPQPGYVRARDILFLE